MSRFDDAIRGFDEANAEDPILETIDGEDRPKELVYGERMSERLARFAPDAPETVKLAARAQHIRRWEIPPSRLRRGEGGVSEVAHRPT